VNNIYNIFVAGEKAKEMYEKLFATLGKDYDPSKIKDGVFGAMMDVQIQNNGPVTIQIESKSKNVNEVDDKE
jgi:D-aminoacyl-tRNA deacylase